MTELSACSYGPALVLSGPPFLVRVPPRWSMCQGPEMKPESGRWVRWTLVRWCHLQWALITGPSCFSALRHTLQHLSEGILAHTTAAENRPTTHRAFITPWWWSQQRSNGADSTSPTERGSILPVWQRTEYSRWRISLFLSTNCHILVYSKLQSPRLKSEAKNAVHWMVTWENAHTHSIESENVR